MLYYVPEYFAGFFFDANVIALFSECMSHVVRRYFYVKLPADFNSLFVDNLCIYIV